MGIHKPVDDTGKEAKTIFEKFILEISNTTATKQIVIGACSGYVAGLLSIRIGRNAVLALGGGIILLQFANEKNYISVNWDTVNKKIDNVACSVEEKVVKERASWLHKITTFAKRNTAITSGFIGGFLIGLAS